MGKVGFSQQITYDNLCLEPDNKLPAADDKSAQLSCGKSPWRPGAWFEIILVTSSPAPLI